MKRYVQKMLIILNLYGVIGAIKIIIQYFSDFRNPIRQRYKEQFKMMIAQAPISQMSPIFHVTTI